jgi:hypothetical protein
VDEEFFIHLPMKMEPKGGFETSAFRTHTPGIIHLPMKLEPKGGSETSAFRTHTPGNYPKENILHKEHGESLKPRNDHEASHCAVIF